MCVLEFLIALDIQEVADPLSF